MVYVKHRLYNFTKQTRRKVMASSRNERKDWGLGSEERILNESEVINLLDFFSMYYKYPTLVENMDSPDRVRSLRKSYREIHCLDLGASMGHRRWINLDAHGEEDMNWLMLLLHSNREGIVFSLQDNKYVSKFLECISYFPFRGDIVLIHGIRDSYIRNEYKSRMMRTLPMYFVEDKLGVIRATPSKVI